MDGGDLMDVAAGPFGTSCCGSMQIRKKRPKTTETYFIQHILHVSLILLYTVKAFRLDLKGHVYSIYSLWNDESVCCRTNSETK